MNLISNYYVKLRTLQKRHRNLIKVNFFILKISIYNSHGAKLILFNPVDSNNNKS